MGSTPNVLLLFSDQHKASVLGCEGHPDVCTPNLDRLAAEGTRFRRAYCQDAVCVPSRCSMLSGLYPRTLGCRTNFDESTMLDSVEPMQKKFQDAGYVTAAFGKRHVRGACDSGWSMHASHFGALDGHEESPEDNYVKWIEEQGYGAVFARDWAAEFNEGPKGSRLEGQHIDHALLATRQSDLPEDMTMEAYSKRRTVEFLNERRQDSQPFFCWTSFYRPHQPYTPLQRYWERFDRSHWGRGRNQNDGIAMPPTLREELAARPPVLQDWGNGVNRVWRLDLARQDEQLFRDYVSAYYALVEEIDDHVGDILKTLEDTGLRDNTMVIYVSDHGDFAGAHGMIEKCAGGHNIYEDTLRVPLLISWPKEFQTGQVCHSLVELVDLFPTLSEICGLEQPRQGLPGRSLASTLTSGTAINREFCVSENWVQTTVITDRYKLGCWLDSSGYGEGDYRDFGDMMFDLEADPFETVNCTEKYPEIKKLLTDHLQAWQRVLPATYPYPTADTAQLRDQIPVPAP